jgi:hypothetical protein
VAETSGEVGAGSEERAAWEAAWSAKRAEVKAAVELEAGSMMFVELMFWKDKSAAREVRRKNICHVVSLVHINCNAFQK